MMNLNTISAVVLSVLVGSAVDFNTEVKNSGKPASINSIAKANGTVIDDFSQEIYSWWTGNEGKYVLERTEDENLKIKITDAGNPSVANGYQCFGRQFDAVDFSKTPVLKIKMKAEGGSPKVRIDLKDANGMVTNAKAVVKTVSAGGNFVEYYYDFSNKWTQAWPSNEAVDPVEIVEFLVFVNPGGPAFTGTLTMDDITAVTLEECPKQ
ncbi:MAG: hypothetical protein K2X86_15360 [Cytophagaceae bacterium]|nr:hypothetical protein [Cytophagaceae bacterium]